MLPTFAPSASYDSRYVRNIYQICLFSFSSHLSPSQQHLSLESFLGWFLPNNSPSMEQLEQCLKNVNRFMLFSCLKTPQSSPSHLEEPTLLPGAYTVLHDPPASPRSSSPDLFPLQFTALQPQAKPVCIGSLCTEHSLCRRPLPPDFIISFLS